MELTMPTLLLSPRYSSDSRLLRSAAERQGWSVVRLGTRTVPGFVGGRDLVFYGEPAYADVVATSRSIALLQPTPTWLTTIPEEHRKRAVSASSFGRATRLSGPAFVKAAPERKPFPSRVYETGAALRSAAATGCPESLPVLVAEPVAWDLEVRCFVCDRAPVSSSPYLREGRLAVAADGDWPLTEDERDEAADFIGLVLGDRRVTLPPAVALDVGRIRGRGWAIVEINSAWGSGLYGCEPGAVLAVLARAAVPRESLAESDRPWVR
jgi:hypothetical protein